MGYNCLFWALSHFDLPPDVNLEPVFRSLTTFNLTTSFISNLLCVAGAICLLCLSRYALHFFSVSFILSVLIVIFKLTTSNAHAPLSWWVYYISCLTIGWAIALAVIFYCYKLTREKVLR